MFTIVLLWGNNALTSIVDPAHHNIIDHSLEIQPTVQSAHSQNKRYICNFIQYSPPICTNALPVSPISTPRNLPRHRGLLLYALVAFQVSTGSPPRVETRSKKDCSSARYYRNSITAQVCPAVTQGLPIFFDFDRTGGEDVGARRPKPQSYIPGRREPGPGTAWLPIGRRGREKAGCQPPLTAVWGCPD